MFATTNYYYEREERMNTKGVSLASVAQVINTVEQKSQMALVTGAKF